MYLTKKIVILIMTFSVYLSSSDFIYDSVPNSKEAIKIYADKKEETVEINFKLHEGIYVYKNKIKVRQDTFFNPFIILGEITFIKDKFFGEQPILEKDFSLNLKLSDTISDEDIYIEYQGCFRNYFCFNKEVNKISY